MSVNGESTVDCLDCKRSAGNFWAIRTRVTDYSSYRSVTGYDIRGAKSCSWPPNVAQDVGCQIWYYKDPKQQSDLCKTCTQLKWKLSACKRDHEHLSQAEKTLRSGANSKYPFEYLSPESKQAKVANMRKAIVYLFNVLRRKLRGCPPSAWSCRAPPLSPLFSLCAPGAFYC